MTFLPMVERELRAAARRKSTYRIRRWTASAGILLGFVFLCFVMLSGSGRTGQVLFKVLTAFAGALCLLTGLFLTADCLSEEKREGTLGLLFLTDLKGHDVVLGKFTANSINAFYGLLALLPVMAISLLLGGVTGGEFWRTALALLNALFVSLAAGTLVSACGRDSRNTLGGTLALLIFLLSLWPLLGTGRAGAFVGEWTRLGWLSPYAPFTFARDAARTPNAWRYWEALFASHLLGWIFLAMASWVLPRTWQQTGQSSKLARLWQVFLSSGSRQKAARAAARPELLALNPIAWLAGYDQGLNRAAWGITGLWGAIVVIASVTGPDGIGTLFHASRVPGFLLKLLIATQAPRFFAQSRQTGALELLLCTPLATKEILRGQWLALRKIFLWPLVVFLLFNLAPFLLLAFRHLTEQNPQIPMAILSSAGGLLSAIWLAMGMVADVAAAGWLGMWLGLTARKPNLAPALTVLFVLVLPSVGFCGLDIFADLLIVSWAVTRLNCNLRWLVTRQYEPSTRSLVRHPAIPVPPVIQRK